MKLRQKLLLSMRRSVIVPSLVFPSNISLFDMDFIGDQYSGGTQPNDATNTDDGRLLRQQIIGTQPNFVENADGSLKTYAGTSAVRRSTRGLTCDADRTNVLLQARSFNNASWTLTGATAAKDQTGRTGVANSCSSVTLTGAQAVLSQAVVSAAADRSMWLEAKQIVGSGGTIALSMDGGLTNPTTAVRAIPGAGALGFNKYRIPLQSALANPSAKITINGAASDKWALDFGEIIDTGATNPADADIEFPPVATTTALVKSWRDRPAAFNSGVAIPSPLAVFMRDATAMWFYIDFWYRRDGALIASDAGIQISCAAAGGVTAFGLQTANNPTITTDLHAPVINKMMCGQSATESWIRLNGGTLVTGAGANPANASTHDDWNTNGAALLRNFGGQRRFTAGSDVASAKSASLAFTT